MKQEPDRKQRLLSSFDLKFFQKIYFAEHKPAHDQKWSDFTLAHPELARTILVKADLMRESKLDRGDVYLRAAADVFIALNRDQTIKGLKHFTDDLAANSEPHKHAIKDLNECEVCSKLTD